MKKKFISIALTGTLVIGMLSGCGNSLQEITETKVQSEESADKDAEDAFNAASEAAAKAAAEALEEAAAKAAMEEANAYYEEGRASLYGLDGYEIDLEAAYTNFEKALELGKTEANFYLGVLYDWYEYPGKDYAKAGTYYEAAGNNPYAWLSLGNLYYYGQGEEEDTAKAQELFEAVIAEGCVEGYLGRGEIAFTDEDFDTALECYNKVLEGEEQIYIAVAMYYIACMYQAGQGAAQDYAKAMEWFEKAADLGYSNAMNGIAYMYENGQGVEQDYAKAMEWCEKSADLGSTVAMNNIAYMYQLGQGVEQDLDKAMEWYEKSADLGNTAAMNNLGSMYFVVQGYAKALGWYEKAADSGDADAMNFIADMYKYGYGVARNSEKEQEWRDKAEAAGDIK